MSARQPGYRVRLIVRARDADLEPQPFGWGWRLVFLVSIVLALAGCTLSGDYREGLVDAEWVWPCQKEAPAEE